MTSAQKTKWALRLNPAGQYSRVLLPKGLAMADEVVVEAPVAVPEAPLVEAPQPDPAVDVQPDVVAPIAGQPAEETAPRYDQLVQKSVDAHEVSVGWTAQQGDVPPEPEPVPGNVVTYAELPYKASLVAAGVDVDQYLAGVVVAANDDERDAIQGVGTVPDGVPEVAANDAERDSVRGVGTVPEVAAVRRGSVLGDK